MVALFVILFVVLLLAVDLILQAKSKRYPLMSSVPSRAKATHARETLRIPKGVFFHPGHTWARLQDGDSLSVGIDDFIQKALGSIDRVLLPSPGEFVRQGDPVISIEHNGRRVQLVAPITGRITAINTDVIENPGLISENPYTDGWLFMVDATEMAASLQTMHVAEKAISWIKEEVRRFREFLAGSAMQPAIGEAMLDGGAPVAGALEHLDENALSNFEQTFLR
jgi:glycine cleavage system H lipoate-binding protein